jgi:hypothetical protein
VRHTQLEQTKHCLVLLKKACRAQTAVSWKQLRQAMEQELAERLAQQQADLAEQLAFVQVSSTQGPGRVLRDHFCALLWHVLGLRRGSMTCSLASCGT